ncbi:MAG: hypothetical protein ACQKHC_01760 [Candidatus Phytoplasma pruni]
MDKSREENETLEKEIQAIQTSLGDDEKVNQTLLNQLQDKQNKIKGLNEKITLLQENEEQLKTIIKQKDEEINALQTKIASQNEEINRLNAIIKEQMDLYVQQGQKIKNLEAHIQTLDKTIKDLEDKNTTLGEENQHLRDIIAGLRIDVAKYKQDLANEKTAHQKTQED